ncbi:MAG TPA: hypothetical protein EYH04_03135 [Archaeoglobus profundus]|nr:hypothetical protein [Archaeoglobus profundus]
MGDLLLIGEPGTGKTLLIKNLLALDFFKKVVWVTTVRTSKIVRNLITDTFNGELWVVDIYTRAGRKNLDDRDVIVRNPLNLNEVSLAIGNALDNVEDDYIFILDSISGLLLYHSTQQVIHILRNILLRIEEDDAAAIFTLVKNAHDIHTETSISLLFLNVIELDREFLKNEKSVKRYIKIIKAFKYVTPEVTEFTIDKDKIILPKHIQEFIISSLLSSSSSSLLSSNHY